MKDYRCSSFCPAFSDIPAKKECLEKRVSSDSSFQSFYNAIKRQNSPYNRLFREIYNSKCSYCGVSLDIQPYLLFEIDHYIHKKHFGSKKDPNRKDNLVFACHICNRKKKDFEILLDIVDEHGISYDDLLNPDKKYIADIFFRDPKFRIQISEEYSSCDYIKAFYKRLSFDHPIRQLDYLLLELTGLINACKNDSIRSILLEIKDKLISARNQGDFC